MDFVFQGFQSVLPVWGYILLLAGAATLSWWTYKGLSTISPYYRYGLITLRSIVFFILLILLLNPLFTTETTYFEKPELLVIMDNSASTSIEKGSYQGIDTYKEVLEELNLADSSQAAFRFFKLDQNIAASVPDSLTFNGNGTNLYKVYEAINNHQRNAAAAVLISDGIFNQGRDPAFEAANIEIPLYTVALGDTSRQKDLIVENIISNTTGYVNTRHPVEVSVLNNGFAGRTFEVQLKKGDQVIDSRTITSESNLSSHTLNFELYLEEEGLQQYNISIPPGEEEWTDANNKQPFSVDVLDEKQRILSLVFEIHPDAGMIRSILLSDENTLLTTRTWLSGNRFIEGPLETDSDSLDLVVIQGYPGNDLPQALREKISVLLNNIPSVILPTPGGSLPALDRQTNLALPIQQTETVDFTSVNLQTAVEPTAHPVMELPESNLSRMPAVFAPIQNLSLSGGAEMLFSSRFRNTDSAQPLIAVQKAGNLRQTHIAGYGWYRIAQSSNEQDREFVRQLFSNLISWTATKPDDKLLEIRPAQTVFSAEQPIVLNAFLTNESGEDESEASVEISISGEEIQERYYSMNNTGNGQYRLELASLPEGIYTFEAAARKGNRLIDTHKGEFSVSSSNIEYVNTQRNDRLLQQMAQRSGGLFYTYDQANRLWSDLKNNGVLAMEQKVHNTLFYPYRHAFWFILVIALLTAEWMGRKYLALP